MDKVYLSNKYKDKALITQCYGNVRSYYIDDLLNENFLVYMLYEVDTTEACLTKDGFAFLKEAYGLDFVAEMIKNDGGDLAKLPKEELIERLNYFGRSAC